MRNKKQFIDNKNPFEKKTRAPFSKNRTRPDQPQSRTRPDQPRTRPDQSRTRPAQSPTRPDQPQSRTRPDQSRTRPDQSRTRPAQSPTRPDQPQSRTRPDQSRTRPDQSRTRPDQSRTRPEFHENRATPEIKNNNEMKYYGFHACLNLWKSRPDDIIRVYVDEKRVREVSPLLKWCASKAKAYHVITDEELSKVSDSIHHEGICVLAKEPNSISFKEMIKQLKENNQPCCLIYLDGVQNPHNIGSIMRVAAHFGVPYIIGERAILPKISPSAYRVAQGGAEHVKLVALDDIKLSFEELELLSFKAIATSSHGGNSLYHYKFHPRTIVVMGSESEGVNAKLLESSKDKLLIPGSGLVESLNVSVATGLILGEYYRQVSA